MKKIKSMLKSIMLFSSLGLLISMMLIRHVEGFSYAMCFTLIALYVYWIDARYS